MTEGLEGLPEHLGRYQLRGLLGRGGMGRILLAYDPVLRREVAIKLIEPRALDPESLPELRYLFHREARATASLRHPGIVEVLDYSGPDAEQVYLVYERIEGPTARAVLEERGPLPAAVVTALGHELALALDHAHDAGIVHRDVKLENVFWTASGRVVLADFGLAKVFANTGNLGNTVQFGTTNLFGSPSCLAPEQLYRESIGPHTDLYALGVLLFEAISGHAAFQGDTVQAILEAVAKGERAPLTVLEVPASLRTLIDGLTSFEPQQRPASAARVAETLRALLDRLEVTDPRRLLAHFLRGEHRHPVREGEPETEPDEAPTKLLASSSPRRSPTSPGPYLLAMVMVVLMLGAGVYLLRTLNTLPAAPTFLPQQSTDAAPATIQPNSEVIVSLKFPGRGTVWVDAREVGTWEDHVRLALPPGPHSFEVQLANGMSLHREVLLISDTEPEFQFQP